MTLVCLAFRLSRGLFGRPTERRWIHAYWVVLDVFDSPSLVFGTLTFQLTLQQQRTDTFTDGFGLR